MLQRNSSNMVSVPASKFNPSIIGQKIVVHRTNPTTNMETIRTVVVDSYALRKIEREMYVVINDSLLKLKIGVDEFRVHKDIQDLGFQIEDSGYREEYATETMLLSEAGLDILGNRITFHVEDGNDRTLLVSDFIIRDGWVEILKEGSLDRILRVKDSTTITV